MSKCGQVWVLALALSGCSSAPMDGSRPAAALFSPRLDIAVGAEPSAVAIADLDGDGHNDIVVARATDSGGITVLFGQGNGTFNLVAASNSAGDTPYALGVADFDRDGALDVAVANNLGAEMAVLFGHDFQTRVAQPCSGAHPFSLAVGDLDGNGTPDVVTSDQVGNEIDVFLNGGSRSFSTAVGTSCGDVPSGVVVGDLDGDGPSRLDAAVALSDSGHVRVFHGQGGGSFSASAVSDFLAGQDPVALALGDLNGDAAQDLAVANIGDNTVSILLGSQGSFASALGLTYPVGPQPNALAIGDIDGDGYPDVVTSNSGGPSITILRGQGGGHLLPDGDLTVGMQPSSVAIGDLNGDGLKDIVVCNLQSDSVSVFLTKH